MSGMFTQETSNMEWDNLSQCVCVACHEDLFQISYLNNSPVLRNDVSLRTRYMFGTGNYHRMQYKRVTREMSSINGRDCNLYTQL